MLSSYDILRMTDFVILTAITT